MMQSQSSPTYEFDLDFEIDEHGHQIVHDEEPEIVQQQQQHRASSGSNRLEHSVSAGELWNQSRNGNGRNSNQQAGNQTNNNSNYYYEGDFEENYDDDAEPNSEGRQQLRRGRRHHRNQQQQQHESADSQQHPWTSAPSSVGAASSSRSFLQDVDLDDDAEAALLDDYLQEAQKSQADYSRMLPPPVASSSASGANHTQQGTMNELTRALPSPQQQQQLNQLAHRRDSADYEVSQVTALMDFETGDMLIEYVDDPAAALAEAAARAEAIARAEEEGELIDVNTKHDPPEADYDPIELHDQVNSALESAPVYSGTSVYSQYPQQKQQQQRQQKPIIAKDRRSRKSSSVTAAAASTASSSTTGTAVPVSSTPPKQPSRPQSTQQQQQQQQSSRVRIPRSSSSTASGDGVSSVAAAGTQDDIQLKQRLRREETLRQQQESVLQQLQSDYDRLLTKHALAEVTIDQLRLGARVNLQHGENSSVGRASRWSASGGYVGAGTQAYNTPSPQQHQRLARHQRVINQQQQQFGLTQQQQQQQQRARSAMTDAQHQQQQQQQAQAAAMRQTSSLPASPSVVANKLARRGGAGVGGRGFDPRLLGGGALIGGKKGQLLRKIQALHKRLDSANLATLPVEEQEQLRAELRQAFDQLQKEFANRIVGGGEGDEDEDDEDEFGGVDVEQLEGELFQLSMRLDELDEQVTENARQSGQKRRTPFRDPSFDRRRSSAAAGTQLSTATAATATDPASIGESALSSEHRLAQLEELYLDLMGQYRHLKQSNSSVTGGGGGRGVDLIDSPTSTGTTTAASSLGGGTSRRELDRLVGELRRIVAESAGRSRLIGTAAQLEAELAALASAGSPRGSGASAGGTRRMPLNPAQSAAVSGAGDGKAHYSPAKSASSLNQNAGLGAGALSENDSGFATSAGGGRRHSSQLLLQQHQRRQRGSPLDEMMSAASSTVAGRRLSRNTDTDVGSGVAVGGVASVASTLNGGISAASQQQHTKKDAADHEYHDLEQDIRWLRDQLDTEIEAEAAAAAAVAAGATPDDAASILSSENLRRPSTARRDEQPNSQARSKDRQQQQQQNRRSRPRQPPFTEEYDREGRLVRRYPLEDDYYYSDEEEYQSPDRTAATRRGHSNTDNDDSAFYENGRQQRSRPGANHRDSRRLNPNAARPSPVSAASPSAGILRRGRRRFGDDSEDDYQSDDDDLDIDEDEDFDDDDNWPEFEYSEYSFYPKRHPRDASPRAAGMRFRGGAAGDAANKPSDGGRSRAWRKVPERRNRGRPVSFENRVCAGCGAEPGTPHRRSACLAAGSARPPPPAYPYQQRQQQHVGGGFGRYPKVGPMRAVHGLRTHVAGFAPPRERVYNVEPPQPLRRYIVTETGPADASSLRRVASVSSLAASNGRRRAYGRVGYGLPPQPPPPPQPTQEFYIYEADSGVGYASSGGFQPDYYPVGRTQSQLDLTDAVKAAKTLHKLSSRLHKHLKRDIIRRSSGSSINLMGVH